MMLENNNDGKMEFYYAGQLYNIVNMKGRTAGYARDFFVSEMELGMAPDVGIFVYVRRIRKDMVPYIISDIPTDYNAGIIRYTETGVVCQIGCMRLEVKDGYVLGEGDLRVEFCPKRMRGDG